MEPIIKKVLGMFLMAVITIITLAGCAGGKSENSPERAKGSNISAMRR